jgi:hypothetical protein
MWLLPPAHQSRLLKGTFLGSFNAGTEVWRRREEYFAAEFEVRGLRLAHVGGGGICSYSLNNCRRCSGCESQGGRDTGQIGFGWPKDSRCMLAAWLGRLKLSRCESQRERDTG